jgi:hypothetical protein
MGEQPRLGQLLLRAGVLDQRSLDRGLAEQERNARPLGMTLVALGLLSEQTLVATLAHQLGLPVAHIASWPVDAEVLELVPAELADKHRCLPLALKQEGDAQSIYLAMMDPSDLEAVEAVRAASGREVRIVLAAPSELDAGIARFYRGLPAPPPPAAGGSERDAPAVPERGGADSAEHLHRWSVSREELRALLEDDPPAVAAAAAGSADEAAREPSPRPVAADVRAALDRRRLEELDAMVRLVMQLLVESGVVSRDALVRRLADLVHERR